MNNTTEQILSNNKKNIKSKKNNNNKLFNNNNNNNESNIKKKEKENINNNKYFKVGTLNVRELNMMAKQQQLINYMNLYNIDILCVQETSILSRQSKGTCKTNEYDCFFSNEDQPKGSGVGIIIKKSISKYIHNVKKYKGRIIILELLLKGKIKFSIMNVYIPTPNPIRSKEEILDLYSYIINEINNVNISNGYNIIIRDFNLNYEKFSLIRKKSIIYWLYQILSQINNKDHHDLIEILYSPHSLSNNSLDTYFPPDTTKSSSRIDYIFTLTNLLQELLTV